MKTESSNYTFKNPSKEASDTFVPAVDSIGTKIRGLWRKGGKYYAQITLTDAQGNSKGTKRALGEFADVSGAYKAFMELKINARDGMIKPVTRWGDSPQFSNPQLPEKLSTKPTFGGLAAHYFKFQTNLGIKSKGTLLRERSSLNNLVRCLGNVPLDKLNPRVVQAHLNDRISSGRTPHSVNFELAVLRYISKFGKEASLIPSNFTEGVKFYPSKSRNFSLVPTEHIEKFCAAVMEHTRDQKAALQMVNFVHFLAYSGLRRKEARDLRWEDIDWVNKQVVVGRLGNTKNGKQRFVDFNGPLEALLMTLKKAHRADPALATNPWIFPAPYTDARSSRALWSRIAQVELRSGVKLGGCHNLRRHFASMCVMQGVDFMTTSKWLGHQDGGILVGKVYGRVSSEHTKRMAQKLKFGEEVAV